ncbi:hypothetical protein K435DRAFT_798483 [Dendrothele bispora CBS 962.96]|uniref:Uncharacterized protein n=1 Tax=Dendrothele bispora (strain CBS 962.96) TaxID=1314807 RepID=A0A4S8LZ69_DENBC|nr:hypothetical protein K435DRAFT_798483 [Dendrothele bispora CBS 962.96]
MENFSSTGQDGFCLEDWITVADSTDPSNAPTPFDANVSTPFDANVSTPFDANASTLFNANASTPFDANTWDANAITTAAPFKEQTSLFNSSPDLSHQRSVLSTDNSLRQAMDGSDKLENDDMSLSGDHTLPSLDQQSTLTLSTAFQATPSSNRPAPDIMLISSDAVVFCVDQQTILNLSTNSFNSLLPITSTCKIERFVNLHQVDSSELNILLHVLYDLDCTQYNPPLSSILSSIDHFPQFGLSPKALIKSKTSVYEILLSQASLHPLEVYCLCGRHDIHELAIPVSSRLLSLALSTLTDTDAESMGSVYLARLFKLHRTRVETLLRLLLPAPSLHNPTSKCGFEQQKALGAAWTMTTAYLSWSAKPDISISTIRAVFHAMMKHITCPECLKGRDERLNKIIVNWSITKNTI